MNGRLLRSVAAILLAGAGSACSQFWYGPPAAPLRVMTFNIHAGKDAKGDDNLGRVAQVILDAKADVVLLQEVDRLTTRSGKVDQVARLDSLTGYNSAFGKTIDYQGGEYGIAVLARWNIVGDTLIHLAIDSSRLRPGEAYEARGVLRVAIAAPNGAIHVLNTHLDATRDDYYRRQQLRTLLTQADSLKDPMRYVIVGGDFNSGPDDAVVAMVRAEGWEDAWRMCGKGQALTYPDDKPVKRIDYLFATSKVKCRSAEVIETNASDHRPVLFELQR